MYVLDLLRSLLRRWYFLLAGILLTGALAVGAFLAVSPAYDTKATMLLLPPKSSVGTRGNPYLYLGGLAQAVEVLSAKMNTPEVIGELAKAHPDATIDIGQDATMTGPILAVTVSAKSGAEASAIVSEATAEVPGVLQQMQDQLTVPDGSRINVITLTPSPEVEEVTKSRDRAVIGIVGVGLAGTLLLTGFIDGLLLGRIGPRRRVEPAPGWTGGSPPPDTPTSPDTAGEVPAAAGPSAPATPARAGSGASRAADDTTA